ncbi:MAG: hypothetical protein LBB08_03055 [Rickettsiales bacterium]|jgi:hypothetical protein|nr:hypothetical protein [Rickettsiales bacterium]
MQKTVKAEANIKKNPAIAAAKRGGRAAGAKPPKTDAGATPKAEVAPVGKTAEAKSSVISWLFVPDMRQGLCSWLARAALATLGFAAASLLVLALLMLADAVRSGAPALSFWSAVSAIASAFATFNGFLFLAFTGIAAFLLSMFAFMPRKALDKTGAVAAMWLYLAVFLASCAAASVTQDYPWWIAGSLIILMFLGAAGNVAAYACYAGRLGIRKSAVFLAFPCGFAMIQYAAFFLPDPQKDKTIAVKSKWYRNFLEFMLHDKIGQIMIAVFCVGFVAWRPMLCGLFLAALFGSLYFWRGKDWCIKNIRTMMWAAVIANIATLAAMACIFGKIFSALARA